MYKPDVPTLSREQRRKRTLKRRKDSRQRNREYVARLRAKGFIPLGIIVPSRIKDAVIQHAKLLKVPYHSVLISMLTVGMRHLTASDIQRALSEWRGVIGAPRPNWKEVVAAYHRQRKAMKEAA